MRYTLALASKMLFLAVGLLVAACPGGGLGAPPDAAGMTADAARPDAPLPPDASVKPDAAAAQVAGHPGTALVPAGATSRSPSYRFVGTLSPGGPAASTQGKVRTGVAGATQ